ncbi:MAG: aminopeptidase N [Pseudomonadota bacterium]
MENDNSSPQITFLKDYAPPPYWCPEITLDVDIQNEYTIVTGTLLLEKNDHATAWDRLSLDCDELELLEIYVDGHPLEEERFELRDKSLTLLDPPASFELKTVVKILPEKNTQLMGFYRSQDGYFTQCEAEGFRRITFSLDRPDVMSRYTTTIHGDKGSLPLLLSNGNIEDQGENGERHWVRWRDPFPKPSYLFAMVAAKLDGISKQYATSSGRQVTLFVYVEPGKAAQAEFALESLQASMRWDEEVFGLELDLDQYIIVAVGDFNMGAMENKGLNIFNTKYVLATPETASDNDYMMLDRVVAHEYFHNWTGNRVTCRDWFQLSLKEGLTVFRDQEYGADRYSRAVQRIQEVRLLRSAQFPEDAGPMAHPIRPESYMEISNFYTATVYNKGAEVVRMIHTLIGADAFRRGMDLYFERHDGQAVRTEEFVAAMADASGYDLSQFRRWYSQAGTPCVTVSESFDPGTKKYSLHFEQNTPATPESDIKNPFHIPIAIGLLSPTGSEIELGHEQLDGGIYSLRETNDEITFENIESRPVPSLLRGFSAPIKLDFAYSDDDLALLMAHDNDPFNQWEAGQRLCLNEMLSALKASSNGKAFNFSKTFVDAFGQVIENAENDPAFTAEALRLPSASYVAENIDVVDAEAIFQVSDALHRELATRHRDALLDVLNRFETAEAYSPDPESAGRRAILNTALSYLMHTDDSDIAALCLDKLGNADNMTNAVAAFGALVHSTSPLREEALKVFFERANGEALVIDKWFAVQASAPHADTLSVVENLLQHPEFNMKNPNRVRSVIGVFCQGNHRNFHAADGLGYRFAADQIMALDPANPQVAARLARAFDRWRRFSGAQQAHAEKELRRIMTADNLSKDTHEVISRALG